MASDDNYAIHLGVSIVSILENNLNNVHIHILNNNIGKSNLKKIKDLEKHYNNLQISLYNLPDYFNKNNLEEIIKEELENTEAYNLLGISTFSRLFLADILPKNIEKVLYLDADTLVLDSLDELFEVDLKENFVAGVIDGVAANITKSFFKGETKSKPFINAGVLLINLKKWRKKNPARISIELIKNYPEKNFLNDQNIINIISENDVLLLDPKYNVMSESFYVPYKKTLKINSYFGAINEFYSEDQINNSLKNPVIVHFITQLWDRPWMPKIGYIKYKCKNPFNKYYQYYKDKSPWKNNEMIYTNKPILERIIFDIRRFIMVYFSAKLLFLVFYIKNRFKFKNNK